MKTRQLWKNPGWDRTQIDPEKLAELATSVANGWNPGHEITYETTGNKSYIVWGHRRTLAFVIATLSGSKSYDEILEFIIGMSGTRGETYACPACLRTVGVDDTECPFCRLSLVDEDGKSVIIREVTVEHNPFYFTEMYDDIIHMVDVDVPAIELPYTGPGESQLRLLQDGIGREDADHLGVAEAVKRAVLDLGMSIADLEPIGLCKWDVMAYMVLANAPQEVRAMVLSEKLPLKMLAPVYTLSDPDKQRAILELIVEGYDKKSIARFVKALKEYRPRQAGLTTSPYADNLIAVRNAIMERMIQEDPVKAWKRIATSTWIYPTAGEIEQVLPCSTCAVGPEKMRQLGKLYSRVHYSCQFLSQPKGCLMHSDAGEVIADGRVSTEGYDTITYDDGMTYFTNYEDALDAYQSVRDGDAVSEGDRSMLAVNQERLRKFIEEHMSAEFASHPYATRCSDCMYQEQGADPPCAWENYGERLNLGYLETEDGRRLPMCRQFSPAATPADKLPDSKSLNKEIMLALIECFLDEANRSHTLALTNLTGVPLKRGKRSTEWASNMLKTTNFSEEKLRTLLAWCAADYGLRHERSIPMLAEHGALFNFTYKEIR